MRLSRFFLIVAVSAALGNAMAEAGRAQTAERGSVKVRPRFFNPFAVGPSSLALNPFGIFSVAQATNSSVPVENATTTPASSAAASDDEGETLAVAAAVRPPFRPRPRSPFRPPPRPPF